MISRFLGLGRSFDSGAAFRLDFLRLGQGGFGHRVVLGFQDGGFGLAPAGLAQFDRRRLS